MATTNTNKLTENEVKKAKPTDSPYKIADGGGMYLLVKPTGGKYWHLAYRFSNKQKLLALGVYPEVSLKEARIKREAARKLLQKGTDPSEAKKEEKRLSILQAENTFEAIAKEWLSNKTKLQANTVKTYHHYLSYIFLITYKIPPRLTIRTILYLGLFKMMENGHVKESNTVPKGLQFNGVIPRLRHGRTMHESII